MSRPSESGEPYTILVGALGGEGGSVLMNWLVAAARASGYAVQATSVPGVAQRTGSTSYYVEMMRRMPDAGEPTFALVPMPGRVDVVVVSELLEAGRLIERGFISPQRTVLIASTSRVYTTAEKVHLADGRFDAVKLEAAARALAKRFVALDLDALARASGTLVSATMFGALAGAGALPWSRRQSEDVIGTGRTAEASRRGFAVAHDAVVAGASQPGPQPPRPPDKVEAAVESVEGLPPAVGKLAALGRDRCADYQDADYGADYLRRVHALGAAAGPSQNPLTSHTLEEAARRLATWMTYEDVPRVAELKTAPERFASIRRDAEMADDQLLHVYEYLKPGAQEIADMLPRRLGARLERRLARGGSLPFIGRGLRVRSTGIAGYALLRLLARQKRRRRGSLRFEREQAAIEAWLAALRALLPLSPAYASALAELPRLRKGYSETYERGRTNYDEIFAGLVTPLLARSERQPPTQDDVKALRAALAAALSDPEQPSPSLASRTR